MTPMEVALKYAIQNTSIESMAKINNEEKVLENVVNVPTVSCAINIVSNPVTLDIEQKNIAAMPEQDKGAQSHGEEVPCLIKETLGNENIKYSMERDVGTEFKASVDTDSKLEESGPGWEFDEPSSPKLSKKFNILPSGEKPIYNKEYGFQNERRQSYGLEITNEKQTR